MCVYHEIVWIVKIAIGQLPVNKTSTSSVKGIAKGGGAFVSRQHNRDPRGFGGSGEDGYLFSGSWGALVIIFRD